jgi:hypothetical protein
VRILCFKKGGDIESLFCQTRAQGEILKRIVLSARNPEFFFQEPVMNFEISRLHAHERIQVLIKRAELDREIREAKLEQTFRLPRFSFRFLRLNRQHA